MNPYQILGVQPSATDSEIRTRFRERIGVAASDRERFEALKAAFDILKDPVERQKLDLSIASESAAFDQTAQFGHAQMHVTSGFRGNAIITGVAAEQANKTMAFQLAPCKLCGTTAIIGEAYCRKCGLLSGSTPGPRPGSHVGPELRLSNGTVHRLSIGKYRIGRDNTDIALSDPSVSRVHAVLEVDAAGNVKLTEAGSTNGTTLDGNPLITNTATFARNGSQVCFGRVAGTITLPNGPAHVQIEAAPPIAYKAVSATGDQRSTLTSKDGKVIPITATEYTVGRKASSHLCIADDTFMSGTHASLVWRDGQTYLKDLGSTNGTFLNELKLVANTDTLLATGDRIRFAMSTYLFRGPESK